MPESRIQVGVIGRAHGVRGWVKVTSHTADPSDLTAYGPLFDSQDQVLRLNWKADGIAEVTRVVNGVPVRISNRAEAEKLTNTRLFIDRSALPPADADEFYLADLIGLTAVDFAGEPLGRVSVVHDYGAGASLEVERPAASALLIPFTAHCVPTVDLGAGRLVVVLPDEVVVPFDNEQAA